MNAKTIYTVLLSDLQKLGYPVFPRPYSESKGTDIVTGLTLHFYLDDVPSEAGGDNIREREEKAAFSIDVNSTEAVADLSVVLGVIESVKYTILNANTNDCVETLNTRRSSTETDNITYTVEVTYNYMERYE